MILLHLSASVHIIYLKAFSQPAFNQTRKLEVVGFRPLCSECQKPGEFSGRDTLLYSLSYVLGKKDVCEQRNMVHGSICIFQTYLQNYYSYDICGTSGGSWKNYRYGVA